MKFEEYYKHYLLLHQNEWNRRLHVLGQLATIATMVYILQTSSWVLIPLIPFVIYPFAWSGHFFFEKNKPAAFTKPLWAKACDWIMLKDIIIGRVKI
jgi:hypothetical protein